MLDGEEGDSSTPAAPPAAMQLRSAFTERARYIPLRLSMEERRLLRLLEAALSVSEYTDKVDIASWRSKSARIHAQIKDICAILSGLVVAQNYKRGQQLIVDRNFQDNAQFFQVGATPQGCRYDTLQLYNISQNILLRMCLRWGGVTRS